MDKDSQPVPTASDDHTFDIEGRPALEIVIDGPTEGNSGQELTYSLVVTNVGDATAYGVVITHELPPETQYARGGQAAWEHH